MNYKVSLTSMFVVIKKKKDSHYSHRACTEVWNTVVECTFHSHATTCNTPSICCERAFIQDSNDFSAETNKMCLCLFSVQH